MAKKDNEEIPFSASPSAGNSEKLKALQAAKNLQSKQQKAKKRQSVRRTAALEAN